MTFHFFETKATRKYQHSPIHGWLNHLLHYLNLTFAIHMWKGKNKYILSVETQTCTCLDTCYIWAVILLVINKIGISISYSDWTRKMKPTSSSRFWSSNISISDCNCLSCNMKNRQKSQQNIYRYKYKMYKTEPTKRAEKRKGWSTLLFAN